MLSQGTVLLDKGCRPSTCDMIYPHYGSHVRYYNQQNIVPLSSQNWRSSNQTIVDSSEFLPMNNPTCTSESQPHQTILSTQEATAKKVQNAQPLSSTIPNQPNTLQFNDRLNQVNRKVLSGGGVSPRVCGGAWLGGHAHWLQAPRKPFSQLLQLHRMCITISTHNKEGAISQTV